MSSGLTRSLAEQIYEYCHDRHLALRSHAEALLLYEDENLSRDAQRQAQMAELQTLRNFGFQKVERLDGNIGYLDLRFFSSPEIAGETAITAMAFLAHTNALIIDLRHNDGGENYMAHLLTSYLVEAEPMLLNSFSFRSKQGPQQCWTLVQTRLKLPPDHHPESGMVRTLYDCPDLPLGPEGVLCRLVVATHQAETAFRSLFFRFYSLFQAQRSILHSFRSLG